MVLADRRKGLLRRLLKPNESNEFTTQDSVIVLGKPDSPRTT